MINLDPMVEVYYGNRGSGKTLSMTGRAVKLMGHGANVWANYSVHFGVREKNDEITFYESKPVDIDDLLMIQRKDEIRDGVVMLDEWNLWCNARRSSANANYIFNGITQLIRKRNLSFFITTQSFHSLDKMIRFQCDISYYCTDLHYRYRERKRGELISQKWTDWNGFKTGRPLTDRDDKETIWHNEHEQIFKGYRYWGCYDTGFEFDVLDVMTTKYSFENKYKTIGKEGLKEAEDAAIRGKLESVTSLYPNGTVFTREEMNTILKDEDITGSMHGSLGRAVKEVGFNYKRRANGTIEYTLNKKPVTVLEEE